MVDVIGYLYDALEYEYPKAISSPLLPTSVMYYKLLKPDKIDVKPVYLVIGLDSENWGIALANYSSRLLLFKTQNSIADSEHDRRCKALIEFLRQQGALASRGKYVSRTQLRPWMRSLEPRIVESILSQVINDTKQVTHRRGETKGAPRQEFALNDNKTRGEQYLAKRV